MNNPLTSRTVISDKIYKKFSQTAYDIHRQKLKDIYNKNSIIKEIENEEESKYNLLRISRNRKANQSCQEKINQKVKR